MSRKLLKIGPPTLEETSDSFGKLNINTSSSTAWDSLAKLKADESDDKRGSFLSIFSEDSRRQSLFAEEDLQDKPESETSSEYEDDDKRKRQDEVFIDKARAAMVVIGTKDIKDALDRKKAVEIFKKTPEAKNASVLFHQARFLMHQSRFREAIVFLDRALTVDTERKEWLTEKSRCYLSLLQPDTALQYVDQVLKKDPKHFGALLLKGDILYSLWDLEKAMLCFVEGRRLRPDSTECIQGMHKVRMALQEVAAYRFPDCNRKRKRSKKRSKSAKGRLTTSPPSEECFLTPNRDQSLSSRRPSSRLTALSFISNVESPRSSVTRPLTAVVDRGRTDSHSISPSRKSDMRTSPERLSSPKFDGRSRSARPKTAAAPRRRRSRSEKSVSTAEPDVDEIRRFVRESMSNSFKSGPLRCVDAGSQKSSRHSSFSKSYSSSMEDVSADIECGHPGRPRLPKVKLKPKSSRGIRRKDKITPETRVSASLAQDKMFLNNLLKDKDLKRSQTAYTKRVLKLAREVQYFVSERETYWRNRERFVRYASADEDTLI